MPVQTFHRFRLIRRIARGGMAEVFLAAHRGAAGFERRVALKKILPVYSGMEEFSSLFKDEARVAAALDHSGIVQVYDFGEHTGEYYIAMEYVDGPDLEEVMDRCRRRGILPPVEVVLHIGHRLAGCLEYAHSRYDAAGKPLSIIHRDVSPPNVLIGVQGEIKLTDFGVAKSSLREGMTRPGVLRGKYAYMSPEQVSQKPMDQRSDLFSLGTVLYEALTGVNPFEGSTDYQTMESVESADVEPAGFLRPDTPAELDRVLVTCLEPDPAHRYQDAGSLRRDLAGLMLDYPRSDDPQSLVDFLQDVFPERSSADNRAELLDGSVPAWEMFTHRLSPMLIVLPPAPEQTVTPAATPAAPPIRLVSRPGEEPPETVSNSKARAIFREVGPKAKRRRRTRGTNKTAPFPEDAYVTDPGAEAPKVEREAPRGAFLPSPDDSLDRISVDSLPVLGVPDSDPEPDMPPLAPRPFVSLAEEGDPLLSDLSATPPMTDAGVPIVNEWDLDEDDWSPPPRNVSSDEMPAVGEGALPPFGRVANVPHHSPMAADLFAEDDEDDEDEQESDDSGSYVPTQPSLSPVSALASSAGSDAPPNDGSPSVEDEPTQQGGLDDNERREWGRLLDGAAAAREAAEPDSDEDDTVDDLDETGGDFNELDETAGDLDPEDDPTDLPPRLDAASFPASEPFSPPSIDPIAAVMDASLDDVAGALTTGTVPGRPVPEPSSAVPAASRRPVAIHPASKAPSALGMGLPTPRMMPARPRRAPPSVALDVSGGWDVAASSPVAPLSDLIETATAGGTQPSAPAWPIQPEELRAWRESQQRQPVADGPEPRDFNPPSSPALRAMHGDFGDAPEPAASLASSSLVAVPSLVTPSSGNARPTGLARASADIPRSLVDGAPSQPGSAPPLRIGRARRSAGPSRPGIFVPLGAGPNLPAAGGSAPVARVISGPGGLNPSRSRPGQRVPEAPPPSGLSAYLAEHRQTLILAALAILVPLLLVFAAGTLDRDPRAPAPRDTPEAEPVTPRYVEPLSPIGNG